MTPYGCRRPVPLLLAMILVACLPPMLGGCGMPYKPTLKLENTFRTIPAKVLVRPLRDLSPPEDKEDATAWSLAQTGSRSMEGDLGTFVTKAIIADFSATGVFPVIHQNQSNPDLVLSGTIHRFYGEISLPSWLRIPGMGWAMHAYWVPFQEWEGEVDLELTLARPDGRILGTYRGRADYAELAMRESATWSMPLYPAHVRLNRAFTEAIEQIREQMFRDRALLLAGIGR
jgi:hypothetical protein